MVLIQEVLLCQSVHFCQNFLYSFSDLQSFVSILIYFLGCDMESHTVWALRTRNKKK